MGGKRFAVLLCAEDSEYVVKMYGGYFGVFVRMLAEEGETWDVYRVASGEFPEDDEIDTFDGFVITGICNDAHGNDVWICKLLSLLKKLDSKKKKILDTMPCSGGEDWTRRSGWDIGITTINFSAASKLSSSVKMPAVLSVKELPARAEGSRCSDVGTTSWASQGHPEYTKDILFHLINRLLQRDFIVDSYADEIKANVGGTEPDREAWKKLCINFLKGLRHGRNRASTFSRVDYGYKFLFSLRINK
ncbi:gamma-glutamyl peptidase 5-like [Populus alba x Populus x berolinensis]|nr:gamma-glutamyl peptidase 5-like [Populus alba x Populus x berolinensis]